MKYRSGCASAIIKSLFFGLPLSDKRNLPVSIKRLIAINATVNRTDRIMSGCAALRALCARLGIEAGQVMAFGDAGNDLEMLSWAGWSFAMANATPEAKAAARFQALSNTEGGVGAAVEQFLLRK